MKRLLVPIAFILLACAAGAVYLGTLRPFAPDSNALGAVPAVATSSTKVAYQKAQTPDLQTGPQSELATATPTAPTLVPAAAQPGATPLAPDVQLTETAIPAQKTLDAIDARAHATWTPTAGPTPTLRAIDATTNILLMGSDLRPNDPTWLPSTDVMMILFLDTTNQRAALLSIPRDTVVAIPHHGAFRINYVYQYGLRSHGPSGGAEMVKQVLSDDLNIRIDHWALIDFTGFEKIVDTLGGIDVHVACSLEDTLDDQHFVIPAGDVRMDYVTAKRYVQSRYSTSDTSRNFRQQRVLWAIAEKGLQLNALDKVPTLWNQLHESIQTDMTLFDLVSLIPAAYTLDLRNHPERIHARVLEYPAVYPFIANYGAWLYMPNYDVIGEELDRIFESPEVAQNAAGPGECPRSAAVEPTSVTATPPP